MKFKTLSSGSKGNCAIVMCGNINLLIDTGISFLSLKNSLNNLEIKIDDITGILITHCHKDHTKGSQKRGYDRPYVCRTGEFLFCLIIHFFSSLSY